MRKLLVLLLVLAVVSGAFAQNVKVSGDVRMDMGWTTNKTTFDGNESEVNKWYWSPADSNVTDWGSVTFSVDAGKVSGWLKARSDLAFFGGANVDIIDNTLGLGFGYDRLPFSYWSSYDIQADNHYSIGASSIASSPFLQINILKNIFVGFADGGKIDGVEDVGREWMPYIYAGYNHPEDGDITFGLGFIGSNFLKAFDDKDVFSWMAKGYFKYIGNDVVTVGVNLAFYSAPQYAGIFDINGNTALYYKNISSEGFYSSAGKDDMVLEALLDAGINLPICDIGIGVGLVMNLADKEKGGGSMGFKLGLDAAFDIGSTGFTVTPGFSFQSSDINVPSSDKNATINELNFGIAFCYSF